MLQVTLRQLQVFALAARTRSYARVAEQLHITPAAISLQIKQLEAVCGFALFERVGRKPVLTDPGTALLGYAQTVLRALDDADHTLRALRGMEGGDVTIGLVSTSKYLVPHILARFKAEVPAITLHLRDGNRREIFGALTGGEVDLAVTGRAPDDIGLVAEAFAEHPSVIVASPAHALARHRTVTPDQVRREDFITREPGSGTRQLMEGFFQSAGAIPRVALTSSSNETIKQAVMAGMGVALMSRHTIGLELRFGLLRVLPVDGFPLMRSWFVVHRQGMTLLPVHRRLRSFLLEQGQGIIDEMEGQGAALDPLGGSPPRPAAALRGTRKGER